MSKKNVINIIRQIALDSSIGNDQKIKAIDKLLSINTKDGGEGSGNFGHEGRPGHVGGSAGGTSGEGASSSNGSENKSSTEEETSVKPARTKNSVKKS